MADAADATVVDVPGLLGVLDSRVVQRGSHRKTG